MRAGRVDVSRFTFHFHHPPFSPNQTVRPFLLLLPLLLSACTPADRLGCPADDLESLGREEALAGKPATLPRADCALAADESDRYLRGRGDGLARYCKAQRGYQIALDGRAADPSVCGSGAAEFSRGFEVGTQLRTHLAERDRLNAQAGDAERAAAQLPAAAPERQSLEQQAATARAEARQHENEVEALRGIVAVEQWR